MKNPFSSLRVNVSVIVEPLVVELGVVVVTAGAANTVADINIKAISANKNFFIISIIRLNCF